jgi:hypothetical protein
MSPEAITAVAAVIAAFAGCGSAVAAVISAMRAGRSEKTAGEARELIRQVISVQMANSQTVHVHLPLPPTTAGANLPEPKQIPIAMSQEITFPQGEVSAIAPDAPAQAPVEAPRRVQIERPEE